MLTPSTTLLRAVIVRFIDWLDQYGELSRDHQSFFAGRMGGTAKMLYYRQPLLGTLAVSPLIFCEAFLPGARRFFGYRQRFPIADAHYAMGFALLARQSGRQEYYERACHFLRILEQTRCAGYRHYCWGYPFDWVTRTGVIRAGTPLITTTPYVYEAFSYVYQLDGNTRWLAIMQSAAEHAALDIPDRELAADVATAGYTPDDRRGGVINASAYRAFLLMAAAVQFDRDDYRRLAERNLQFVLNAQQADGSWFYAADGVRDFVDHFHTCFILKALAKIQALVSHAACRSALATGVAYYGRHLFDEQGLPKPFARRPRLTVYRRELYDYAECINLGVLLYGQFQELDERLQTTLTDLIKHWQRHDGSFRARRLLLGWDNTPMHRWAQAQLFRSLCYLLQTLPTIQPAAPAHRNSAVDA